MSHSDPFVQSLESRTLFAAAQPLTHVDRVFVTGAENAITSVVLHFTGRLDPATAQDVRAYRVGRTFTVDNSASAWDYLLGTSPGTHDEFRRARLASAVYDDTNQTVTLTPQTPFKFRSRLRTIKIFGARGAGVKTVDGQYIDGNLDGKPGKDQKISFTYHKGKTLSYTDGDGDKVKLTLAGQGQITSVVANIPLSPTPIIIASGTDAAKSVLTGKITQKKNGNGTAEISEIIGLSTLNNQLPNDLFSVTTPIQDTTAPLP